MSGVERVGECIQILRPDWTITGVNAGFTTRCGGVSKPPYDSLNLAMHVGDNPAAVRENRRRLVEYERLAEEPRWLKQVHSARVVHASDIERDVTEADAVWTDQPGQVCAVLVADCVPILLAANTGRCVAAIHAGWRGLAAGVIEATIEALPVAADELSAVVGPCIGKDAYEVGPEVIHAFHNANSRPVHEASEFTQGCVYLDCGATAQQILHCCGIESITQMSCSTFQDSGSFYSHRRVGVTGRFSAFITLI